MNLQNINIDSNYIDKLHSLAQEKGETTESLLSKIINEYINRSEFHDEQINLMKLSENSFSEWDNEEDSIYDTML